MHQKKKKKTFLREDPDGLGDERVTDRAFGMVQLADTDGALHAEEVVAAGHQSGRHFTLEAGHAVSGRGGLAVGTPSLGVAWPYASRSSIAVSRRFREPRRQPGQGQGQASEALGALLDIVSYLFGIIRVTPALGTFRTEVGAWLVSIGRGREVGFAVNAHTNSNVSTSGTS